MAKLKLKFIFNLKTMMHSIASYNENYTLHTLHTFIFIAICNLLEVIKSINISIPVLYVGKQIDQVKDIGKLSNTDFSISFVYNP